MPTVFNLVDFRINIKYWRKTRIRLSFCISENLSIYGTGIEIVPKEIKQTIDMYSTEGLIYGYTNSTR